MHKPDVVLQFFPVMTHMQITGVPGVKVLGARSDELDRGKEVLGKSQAPCGTPRAEGISIVELTCSSLLAHWFGSWVLPISTLCIRSVKQSGNQH